MDVTDEDGEGHWHNVLGGTNVWSFEVGHRPLSLILPTKNCLGWDCPWWFVPLQDNISVRLCRVAIASLEHSTGSVSKEVE